MGQSAKLERQSLRNYANIPNFHDAQEPARTSLESHILPPWFILLGFTFYSQAYSSSIYSQRNILTIFS